MAQRIYPIIVTTWEALYKLLEGECSVVYVDEVLYYEAPELISEKLESKGYVRSERIGKQGVFFEKRSGLAAFDPETQEIYDPMDLL